MKILSQSLILLSLLIPVFRGTAQIGDPAPDFTATDTHGGEHRLYDYLDAGKTVVLDFFYTTCIPCQYYTPQVNLAYEKYGCNASEVIFMSIDYNDTDAEVLAYDAEYNIHYPSISGINGGGNAIVSAYGIFGFPTFYVIDSTHRIVQVIDPPTLQVFDYRFDQLGIAPVECGVSANQDFVAAGDLQVFPNPVISDMVHVLLPVAGDGISHFEIHDMVGRRVLWGEVSAQMKNELSVSVNTLVPGLYLFQAHASNGQHFASLLIRY